MSRTLDGYVYEVPDASYVAGVRYELRNWSGDIPVSWRDSGNMQTVARLKLVSTRRRSYVAGRMTRPFEVWCWRTEGKTIDGYHYSGRNAGPSMCLRVRALAERGGK